MTLQVLISDFHCDGTWITLREGIRKQVSLLGLEPKWKDIYTAYALATVKHECADTWRPITEYGKGRGKDYQQNSGWGRGLVQLTWNGPAPNPNNYLRYQNIIGLPLCRTPDIALRSDVSLFILVHGMYHGIFTGRGFRHYPDPKQSDFPDMRKIINGEDKCLLIAEYAAYYLSRL